MLFNHFAFSSKINGEHGLPLQNSYTLFITSKNMCKTNRFIKAGVKLTPLLKQNHTLNHQKPQNNTNINY